MSEKTPKKRPPRRSQVDLHRRIDLRDRVDRAMERNGIRTRDELGRAINMEGGLLGMKLNGRRGFTIEEVTRLSEALGLSLHYLVTGEGPMMASEIVRTPEQEGVKRELLAECLRLSFEHHAARNRADQFESIAKKALFLYHVTVQKNMDKPDLMFLEIYDTYK